MRRIYSVVILACAFLVSCGTDEGFTFSPTPSGRLTVINAIPTSPELTVVTNNLRSGLISFGQTTGNSTVLPQIPIGLAVSFLNDTVVQTVLDQQVTIDVDGSQIVVLTGSLDNTTAINIIEAPFSYETGTTDTRIRFLNATNVASATVNLTNPNGNDESIAMTNGQPTGFTTATAGGGNQIEVRDTSTNAVLWRSGDFFLTPGADRLIMLLDYFGPGDETVRLVSLNDPSGTVLFPNEELVSAVRFVNQTATNGQLDFRVDGAIAASLNFGDVSDFIEFSPGSKTFSITPAGDPTTELNSVDRILFLGSFQTIHAAVNDDNTGINTSILSSDRRPIATLSQVSITKLSPAVPTVDMYFQDSGEALTGTPDITGLTNFNPGTISLRPKSYDLYVTEAGNANILIGPTPLNLESLGIYTIQITDAAGGGTPLRLVLLDDFLN
jgi:hypothetical protein